MGGLTVALLSGSKGSWLPLLVVGPVAFLQATRNLHLRSRLKWAAALLVYTWLISNLPHNPIVSRAQIFSQHGDSFRVAYWKESGEMIKASPLIGVGRQEVSRRLVDLTTRQYGSPLPPGVTRDLHNEYLDILAARGVLGLMLVLSTLGVPLVLLTRSARDHENSNRYLAVSGILFVVAFAICGLTDVQFQINAKRMTYVLVVVLFVHFASRNPCRNP
jgi:O-antigen ligase